MKQNLLLPLCLLFLWGCKKEPVSYLDSIAYYRFEPNELAQMPTYKVGDSLIFKNQRGESRVYKVIMADTFLKHRYTAGIGFFGPHAAQYFFYDALQYRFVAPDDNINWEFYFRKWPLSTEEAEGNIEKLFPAKIYGQMYFVYWNDTNERGDRNIYLSLPDSANTTLSINGRLYPNVAKIVSNNPTTVNSYKDINTIYYGFKDGLIGLDDVDGNQWRIQQ